MIERTRHATTNYKMILPYIEKIGEIERPIRFKASGFMDLTVESLSYKDYYGNPVYSITHYGEQNGDLMCDPDMTFSINREAGTIIPLSYRNDYMGICQEVIQERKGKMMYCVSLLKDLDYFLWMWLKNIKGQGFTPDVYEVI